MRFERRGFGGRDFRGRGFGPREDLPKPVNVGEEYDVEISEVGSRGDGIARVKNFVVFVNGVKQGDKVRIKIKEVRDRFAIGEKAGEGATEEVSKEPLEETTEEKAEEAEEPVEEKAEEAEEPVEEKAEEAEETVESEESKE